MRQGNPKHYAVNLLSRREYTREELRRKLKQRGFVEEEITSVLEDLMLSGLQSDQRYTEMYIRMRANKGFGIGCIRQELYIRGIGENLVEIVLEKDEIDWQFAIRKALRKKFKDKFSKNEQLRLVYSHFLYTRGFDQDQIRLFFADLTSEEERA